MKTPRKRPLPVPLLSKPFETPSSTLTTPIAALHPVKRRRTGRACDTCRSRKVRCDLQEHETACKQCLQAGTVCTFLSSPKRRGPRSVTLLEQRIQRMEYLLANYRQTLETCQVASSDPQLTYTNDCRQMNSAENVSICKYLISMNKLQPKETINGINDWVYRVAGISKQTSDELLKIYFAYIYPVFPVINKVIFLQQYRDQVNILPSPALLYAIYGSSVRYIESCKAFRNDELSASSVDVIRHRSSEEWSAIHMKYVKDDSAPCLSTIQSLIIYIYHRSSANHKWTDLWALNGLAIRMAQEMGLHRSCQDGNLSENEKEARKRLWGMLYTIDRWISAGTGRPLTALDEDCDLVYPGAVGLDELMDDPYLMKKVTATSMDSGYQMFPQPLQQPRFPSVTPWRSTLQIINHPKIPFFEALVQIMKLSKILGNIMQGLYTPAARKKYIETGNVDIVIPLEASLAEWRANLPHFLQINGSMIPPNADGTDESAYVLSGILGMCYYTTLILLHRLFIEAKSTPSSQLSLQICTNAAIRCVDIVRKVQSLDHTMVTYGFIIYPVFIASLIHLYNADSPDSMVADVAKANFLRVLDILQLFGKLSPLAEKLYTALHGVGKRYHHLPTSHVSSSSPGSATAAATGFSLSINGDTDCMSPSAPSLPSTPTTHSNIITDWLDSVCTPVTNSDNDALGTLEFHSFVQFGIFECPYHSAHHTSKRQNETTLPSLSAIFEERSPPYADFLLYGHQIESMGLSSQPRFRPGNVFWNIPTCLELNEWPSSRMHGGSPRT